jgi:hypothetical protein
MNYGEIVGLVAHLGIDPRPLFDQWSESKVIDLCYRVDSITL